MNFPDPDSPIKHKAEKSVLKRIAIIGLVVATFFAGLGVGIPFIVKEMAGARIDRVGASLKGVVTHDDFRITGLTTLFLPRLTFTDPDGLEISVQSIEMKVDPVAIVTGGRKITSIDVGEVTIQGGTENNPIELAKVAGRLISRILKKSGRDSDGLSPEASSDAKATTPPHYARTSPLPDVSVRSIRGRVFSSYISGEIRGGSAQVRPDPASIDAHQRVAEITVDFRPSDSDKTFVIKGQADIGPGFRPERAVTSITPPFSAHIRGMNVQIGGVAWRPREIRVQELRASLPHADTFPGDITAQDVLIRWKPLDGGDVPAMRLFPDAWKKYIPGPLEMLMNAVAVSEVRVTRPVLNVVFPRAKGPESPVAPIDDEDDAKPSVELRGRVVAWFSRLLESVESSRKGIVELASGYHGTRIGITGATIGYARPGAVVKAGDNAPSLSNLDLLVERTEKSSLSVRLRFESPESSSTQNEFALALGLDGNVDIDIKASRLLLEPYRFILPGWLHANRDTALTDTALKVRIAQNGHMEITGRANVSDVDVNVPEIASTTMTGVDLGLSGTTVIDGPAGSLTMLDSTATLGEMRLPFSMAATSLNSSPILNLDARIERLDGSSLISSIPAEAIPVLAGARLDGTFAATMKLQVNTADITKLVFEFSPDMADLVTVDLGPAVNLELLRSTFVHRIEDDNKVITRKIGADSPDWIPYDKIPADLVHALIYCEDAKFFSHQGFSKVGIERSLKVNLEKGGFFQGASTLSQQLVKNLFLSREKTLSRKLQEAFITWQIEKNLPKEKILELYLNVIEWGPDVWGLRAAAAHYFGKEPAALTVLESAFLVLIIPNPTRFHKFFTDRRVPASFMARVRNLVSTMNNYGVVSDLEVISAAQQTIRFVNAGKTADLPDSEFSD